MIVPRILIIVLLVILPGSVHAVVVNESEIDIKTREISKTLRCTVCQTENIWESGAPLAQQMRAAVRERVAQGQSDEEIREYFLSRYGDYILMQPPTHGINWLIWLAPFFLLLGGGLFLYKEVRHWVRDTPPPPSEPLPPLDHQSRQRIERELQPLRNTFPSLMLLVFISIILVFVIAVLISPFWRKDPSPLSLAQADDHNQELADLGVEREVLISSLQELDVELAQGRMHPEDHARLKATDERRLLQVLDQLDFLTAEQTKITKETTSAQTHRKSWIPATVCAVLVLVSSFGIYTFVQFKAIQKLTAVQNQMTGNGPNPLEMVAKLEERLSKNPDDLQGQVMAGRSYMTLERFDDAQKAWGKVLELDPKNHEAHYNIGVMLVERRKFDDPELFKQALAHFDTVLLDLPKQPGVNWYRGLALWYLNRYPETDEAWTTAFQNLDPSSKDAKFVKAALTKLRAGETPF